MPHHALRRLEHIHLMRSDHNFVITHIYTDIHKLSGVQIEDSFPSLKLEVIKEIIPSLLKM